MKLKQETGSTSLVDFLKGLKDIPAGEPLWEGSKLKSTGFTYLNKEEISVQRFYASYALRQELFSESEQQLLDSFFDELEKNNIKIIPDLSFFDEVPKLQRLCKIIRKITLLETANYQINYLLKTT